MSNEKKFKLRIFVFSLNDSIWIQYDWRNCICIRKGFIDFEIFGLKDNDTKVHIDSLYFLGGNKIYLE